MKEWSSLFQNPKFFIKSRMQIMDQDMKAAFRDRISLADGLNVLDVGCGIGLFDFYLADTVSGCHFTGLDLDENLIHSAKDMARERKLSGDKNEYVFTVGNAAKLPFEDSSFDIVVSHTFLTSMPDYMGAIKEMKRVCRKGGVIASVTCAGFNSIQEEDGYYNIDATWIRDYRNLREKVNSMYEAFAPLNMFANGIKEEMVPKAFSDSGLTDVCVYPQGYFHSLSNAAISKEDKRKYIELDYESEKERFTLIHSFKNADQYLSNKESELYLELLEKRRSYLVKNIGENKTWEYISGLNYLVTGRLSSEKQERTDNTENEYERTKYKACKPEETVSLIQNILEKANVSVTENHCVSGVNDAFSLRIAISGTDVGQNGKGTSYSYAKASGYAEFMERLQTGYLFQTDVGFDFHSPDIELRSEDELLSYPIVTDTLNSLLAYDTSAVVASMSDKKTELSKWNFAKTEEGYRSVPFKALSDGHIEYLPEILMRSLYFTNGSCAGNTESEALVQGLSEIMERYVADRILREKLTPPTIPLECFDFYPTLKRLISEFLQYKDVNLRIMDASLGKGFPVIAVALINRKTGQIILRFGSHPRPEVALERSLTEILQGKSIKNFELSVPFEADHLRNCSEVYNMFNFIKTGSGSYPVEFYGDNPSWTFSGLGNSPLDIEGQLKYMLDKCKNFGWNLYVRNCCFTEFRTYQIVVPGVSDLLNYGKIKLFEKKLSYELKPVIRSPKSASIEQLRMLSAYLALLQNRIVEREYSFASKLPVDIKISGVKLDCGLYHALVALALGEFDLAEGLLRNYSQVNGDKSVFYIVHQLVKAKREGLETDKFEVGLKTVFGEEKVTDAKQIIEDPLSCLPSLNCWNCNSEIDASLCAKCRYSHFCKMDIVRTAAKNVSSMLS